MEKVTFYAIEGLDGVGKTTLINNLSKKGFSTYKTPSNEYSCLRSKLHSLNKSSFFFYLSSLAYLFENDIKHTNKFFVDRYLFSTIGNYSFRNNLSMKKVNRLFDEFYQFLPQPMLTIFLVLDYEERIKRIKLRNLKEKNFDNLDINYNNYILDMIECYKFPKIIIDAKKNENEILDKVIKIVDERI